MENKHPLKILVNRLNNIGIEIELSLNYPWVYLDTVNNNKVKEKRSSEHFYTVAYLPIRPKQEMIFLNLKELFEIIRKYK